MIKSFSGWYNLLTARASRQLGSFQISSTYQQKHKNFSFMDDHVLAHKDQYTVIFGFRIILKPAPNIASRSLPHGRLSAPRRRQGRYLPSDGTRRARGGRRPGTVVEIRELFCIPSRLKFLKAPRPIMKKRAQELLAASGAHNQTGSLFHLPCPNTGKHYPSKSCSSPPGEFISR